MILFSDLEYTLEEDEAWSLFLCKFENLPEPQPKKKNEEDLMYNISQLYERRH